MANDTDLLLLIRALALAAERHCHQRRKDALASPYINHPIELARLLAVDGGIDDPVVLCAAILHDTIEDTDTSATELEATFGAPVARVVLEVTDDKSLPRETSRALQVERAPHNSRAAQLVKLADKICNVRDMLMSPPADWPLERRRDYIDWAARVVDGLRGVHPVLEAKFDALLARRGELGP